MRFPAKWLIVPSMTVVALLLLTLMQATWTKTQLLEEKFLLNMIVLMAICWIGFLIEIIFIPTAIYKLAIYVQLRNLKNYFSLAVGFMHWFLVFLIAFTPLLSIESIANVLQIVFL